MSKRDNYILQNSVDARWFMELKSIKRPLLLESLEISPELLAVEMQKFLSSSTYNPEFKYNNLNIDSVSESQEKLLKLRESVWQNEADSSIRFAYVEKLTELIDEQRILQAAADNDVEKFNLYNNCRFGDLDVNLIGNLVTRLNQRYDYNFINEHPGQIDLVAISDEELESLVAKFFSGWPSLSVAEGEYDSGQVQRIWQDEIKKYYLDWSVVCSEKHFHMKVNSRKRIVYIPKDIKLHGGSISGLFAHEIGTHVYRREQGKKFPVQLSSIGLAGNDVAEEGIALLREYAYSYNNLTDLKGGDKYLALAYATGLIDGEKKDFRDTFNFLRDYYTKRHSRNFPIEVAEKKSLKRSWNSTVRVFRGGNTAVPGSCFLRDKIYREGHHLIMSTLKYNPEYFSYAGYGKFDITNKNQRELIDKYK